MKRIKKLAILLTGVLLLTTMATACSKTDKDASESGKGATAGTVSGVYLSPAKMSYSNMRPTYNFYTTTIDDQKLTIFEDGTYCLTVVSTQFSAVVLPETGNDFSANEKSNYFRDYYGTYTQAVDELDSDLVNITLSKPTRVTEANDSTYYVDSANWTDAMSTTLTEIKKAAAEQAAQYAQEGEGTVQEVETVTAESFLAEKAFEEAVIHATVSTSGMEFVELATAGAQQ